MFALEQNNCITGLIALVSGSCTANLALVVFEIMHSFIPARLAFLNYYK